MTSCKKGQCTLILPAEGVLVFSCDRCAAFRLRKGKKKPDFVVFYQRRKSRKPCWYIIEMKGAIAHPRRIVEQLQAGIDVIQGDPRFAVRKPSHDLVPVVLYYGRIRAADFDQRSVSFFGKRIPIKPRRCGVELASLEITA
jgi:hypothetical protein